MAGSLAARFGLSALCLLLPVRGFVNTLFMEHTLLFIHPKCAARLPGAIFLLAFGLPAAAMPAPRSEPYGII
jgi:hypothetical protein